MNGEYIYNETLVGTIDGVNKEFTTLYDIERIEEVYYLGASYRAVSFVGNVVTFADAPLTGTTAPSIDYFKASLVPTPTSSTLTLNELINDVYLEIGQERTYGATPNKVYKEDLIKKYINEAYRKALNYVTDLGRVGQYSFMAAKQLTTIGYNASYVEIGEDKTYVPANGIFLLGGRKICTYSAYTGGKLMGATGITYDNGEIVALGYKIPEGVKKPVSVSINGIILEYVDSRQTNAFNHGWSMVYSGGNRYIIIPQIYTDSAVVVDYVMEATELANNEDLVHIEKDYKSMLTYYTVSKILKYREDDRWQGAEMDYKEKWREWRSYKSREVDGPNKRWKSNVLINF